MRCADRRVETDSLRRVLIRIIALTHIILHRELKSAIPETRLIKDAKHTFRSVAFMACLIRSDLMIPALNRLSTSSAFDEPEHRHAMLPDPRAEAENALSRPRSRAGATVGWIACHSSSMAQKRYSKDRQCRFESLRSERGASGGSLEAIGRTPLAPLLRSLEDHNRCP